MRVVEITRIENFKSIAAVGPVALGDITLLVGPNNGGKSSILQTLLSFQNGLGPLPADAIRLGADAASIRIVVSGSSTFTQTNLASSAYARIGNGGVAVTVTDEVGRELKTTQNLIPSEDPHHQFVPFLASRRPESYDERVSESSARAVHRDLRFLTAKLSLVGQPSHPQHKVYAAACMALVGEVVSVVPSANGQLPGVLVGRAQRLTLPQLGSGIAHIVGLLAELAVAEDKTFVIEEPENDLHPRALRRLLDLIEESARRNQFLISTHSSLVLRHLGARPESRIYWVEADAREWPPTTRVREVAPDPDQRSRVLIDLGYELRDLELFDGWLFLEEASAETIINLLIPWFARRLIGRLRTVSARGVDRVEPAFRDFQRLMLFTHLEERYRSRAWVVVDGDEKGQRVIEGLRHQFCRSWPEEHFRAFTQKAFERYYPERFEAQVEIALTEPDAQRRRQLKRDLLIEVRDWASRQPEDAREAFERSAGEVIEILREIEAAL